MRSLKQSQLREVRKILNEAYFLCEEGEAKHLIFLCIEEIHSGIHKRDSNDFQSWPNEKFRNKKEKDPVLQEGI